MYLGWVHLRCEDCLIRQHSLWPQRSSHDTTDIGMWKQRISDRICTITFSSFLFNLSDSLCHFFFENYFKFDYWYLTAKLADLFLKLLNSVYFAVIFLQCAISYFRSTGCREIENTKLIPQTAWHLYKALRFGADEPSFKDLRFAFLYLLFANCQFPIQFW